MTPEDYYKESGYPEMKDKRDKRIHQFGYYDLIDFAGRYYEKETLITGVTIKEQERKAQEIVDTIIIPQNIAYETIQALRKEVEELKSDNKPADDTIENGIKAINFMKGFNKG